ncbi:hypothetical protein [Streptomyces qinglanensis]|uniref:hypothetical protein n=1 Tax=Streptomyces qinglanensis TaxID=943816 RepID=UPI003D7274C1
MQFANCTVSWRKKLPGSAAAQETRRVAEVLEFLDRDDEARSWWEKAALKGDEDARDYLYVVDSEQQEERSECCGQEEENSDEYLNLSVKGPTRLPSTAQIIADLTGPVSAGTGAGVSEESQVLVQQVEDFLTRLDPTTGRATMLTRLPAPYRPQTGDPA